MGMGASQAGTTTTTNAPYSPYLPYIGTGLGQAANLLKAGGPNYYPGQQVASFNPIQSQAFGGIQQDANAIGGLSDANSFDKSLLSSGGGSNPYENAMFNQAALATQGQLSSEFAGSGRNLDASMPLRSDQLNNLANSFYGGQYENNIQNALQAGNQAQNVYNTRIGGQQALLGAGNQIQNQGQNLINASMNAYNYNQNQPYNNLGRYMQTIAGLQGSSQSQPYFQNQGANLLGTALAGQQLYNGMGSKPGGTSTPTPSYTPSTAQVSDIQAPNWNWQ